MVTSESGVPEGVIDKASRSTEEVELLTVASSSMLLPFMALT